jgi:poly(3-hydroxybutyrate) depolymerase
MKSGVVCLALAAVVGVLPAVTLAACGNGDDDDTNGDAGRLDATTAADGEVMLGDELASAGDDGSTGPADGAPSSDAAPNDAASQLDAGPAPDHATGQKMTVQGTARTYDITVPLDCATTTTKVPLVIILHGDGEQGADMYRTFGLEQAAKAVGDEAVFVYPNGTNNVNPPSNNAWNLYADPGKYPYPPVADAAAPTGNDDVDYLDQIITTFDELACVDKRVFVTGISSGGYMANQYARWRSSVVSGVAPMSGEAPTGNEAADYPDCVGTTGPVPALIIHGTADTVLVPANGEQTASYWDQANKCASAAKDCAYYPDAGNDDLAAPPATPTTAISPSPCVSSNGCTLAPVTFCLVPGLDHEIWNEAGAVVWKFIAATRPDGGA